MLISVGQKSGDSCSLLLNETVNGSLHFTVTGYSLSKGIGVGKCISSETFNVGGYDWAIYFYPDGKDVEDDGMHVSVFIALVSEGWDVKALFELTLLDQSGKGRHRVHSHFDQALEGGPFTLKYQGSMWGYKQFFRRTTLEISDYLRDDCLSFHGTVGVVKEDSEGVNQYSIPVPPLDIREFFRLGRKDLQCLFESGLGCDIVIQDVLLFIYSDKLSNADEYGHLTSTSESAITLQHLLAASGRFGLYKLKFLCEEKLCGQIDVETVATTLSLAFNKKKKKTLSLADQHGCSYLKTDCLKVAARYFREVKQTEGFKYLENNCPPLFSELMETVASMDEKRSETVGWKRSGSSSIGIDVAAERLAAVDMGSADGKRIRSFL